MKILNILVFLLIFNTFLLLGYLISDMTTTGKVVYQRITANVTSVIDGDTIVIDTGEHVRLLGINTPEKKQPFYQEAADNLGSLVLGKIVDIEDYGKDKYDRTLGYIYLNDELINKKQLERGFANLYYYGTDEHYDELKKAEELARQQQAGLWKQSDNSGCIKLINLQWKEITKRCNNEEQLILQNKCGSMNVIIKDDANHISSEKIPAGIFYKNYSCVWNDEGDTLMIRDNSGLLLFYRYP